MYSKHRFLVDENLGTDVLSFLKRYSRIKAWSVREVSLAGAADKDVISYARQNRLLLLTHDKLLDERRCPVCTHFGILVIRTTVIAKELCARLKKVFQSGHMAECYHAVVHIHGSYFNIVSTTGTRRYHYG